MPGMISGRETMTFAPGRRNVRAVVPWGKFPGFGGINVAAEREISLGGFQLRRPNRSGLDAAQWRRPGSCGDRYVLAFQWAAAHGVGLARMARELGLRLRTGGDTAKLDGAPTNPDSAGELEPSC